jgi:hypothetical protein
MIEMAPQSIIIVYAITIGLATAVLVGLAAQYLVFLRGRVKRESRMQKSLVEALKTSKDRKLAA